MNVAEDWLDDVQMVRNLLSMLTGMRGWSGWERDGSMTRESGCTYVGVTFEHSFIICALHISLALL